MESDKIIGKKETEGLFSSLNADSSKMLNEAVKRRELLRKILTYLHDIEIGSKLKLTYRDNYIEGIVTMTTDDSIDIVSVNNKNQSAGYSCKDIVDLIVCIMADFNEGILLDITE